jgi:proteasome lid subunit RPN8/RPN11
MEHVRSEAPREAVGLICGRLDGQVEHIFPLPNLAGEQAFFADPYAQYQAEKNIHRLNAVSLGYYHSHPGGGVNLSNEDRHFARRIDWTYLVVAITTSEPLDERAAAYRWVEGQLREIDLRII